MPIQDLKDIEEAKELARLECRQESKKQLALVGGAIAWGVGAFLFLKAFIYFMGW